jgi:hypothetical protein
MRRTLIFMVLGALLYAVPAHAKEFEMHHAKVLDQQLNYENRGTAVVPLNGMLVGVPINGFSNTVTIESMDGKTIFTLRQTDKKPLILTVGADASFYLDGNTFCFPDSKGKKHTFALIHMEQKQ